MSEGRSGFGLGLALGVLYVPCAGPVLAAIVVAGATGSIGLHTVALTVSFAIGAALPLLFFALAGQRVAERVGAFRRHQRRIRVVGGIVMLAFAVALVFNVPAKLQRAIPDYTSSLQDKVVASDEVAEKLNLGGLVNDQNRELSNCTERRGGARKLRHRTGYQGHHRAGSTRRAVRRSTSSRCAARSFSSTSGRTPASTASAPFRTSVDWYDKYNDSGLEVIGVHSPEYAFEKIPGNVASGADDLGITYPVALDNNLSTWTNYRNRYWPAEYLDRRERDGAPHQVRRRRLRRHREPDQATARRRQPGRAAAAAERFRRRPRPMPGLTPETYLGVGKMVNYGGPDTYDQGTADFTYPTRLADDSVRLPRVAGRWTIRARRRSPTTPRIALNYHAKNVYLVVGGEGTVTVTQNGKTTAIPISGRADIAPDRRRRRCRARSSSKCN